MQTSTSPQLPSLGRLMAPDRDRPCLPELPPQFSSRSPEGRQFFQRLSQRRGLVQLLGLSGSSTSVPESPRPAPRRQALKTLLNRVSFGWTADEYAHARTLGYDAYLEEQLDPASIDDSACDLLLANLPTIYLSPKQLAEQYTDQTGEPFFELKSAALVRAVFSKHQLFERMCELWNDHFNIYHLKGIGWSLLPEHDLQVVRQNALGNFPDLLRATAKSSAMLHWLDNWVNTAGAPNENYARELFERHSLGLDNGYTEADISAAARALSGWTLVTDENSPDHLQPIFDPSLHAPGPKTVLAVTIPADPPEGQLDAVIDLIAMHPNTARTVATKLVSRFLNENPPASIVDQVTQVYLATGGDIKAMLRVILARPNLYWRSTVYGLKFRRPFHHVAAMLRGFGLQLTNPFYAMGYLYRMGHMPFDWPRADGYPDTVEAWTGVMLPRIALPSFLLTGFFPGVEGLDGVLASLAPYTGENVAGLAQRVNERLLGGALPNEDLSAIQTCLDDLAPLDDEKVMEGTAIAASAPGYQWY